MNTRHHFDIDVSALDGRDGNRLRVCFGCELTQRQLRSGLELDARENDHLVVAWTADEAIVTLDGETIRTLSLAEGEAIEHAHGEDRFRFEAVSQTESRTWPTWRPDLVVVAGYALSSLLAMVVAMIPAGQQMPEQGASEGQSASTASAPPVIPEYLVKYQPQPVPDEQPAETPAEAVAERAVETGPLPAEEPSSGLSKPELPSEMDDLDGLADDAALRGTGEQANGTLAEVEAVEGDNGTSLNLGNPDSDGTSTDGGQKAGGIADDDGSSDMIGSGGSGGERVELKLDSNIGNLVEDMRTEAGCVDDGYVEFQAAYDSVQLVLETHDRTTGQLFATGETHPRRWTVALLRTLSWTTTNSCN